MATGSQASFLGGLQANGRASSDKLQLLSLESNQRVGCVQQACLEHFDQSFAGKIGPECGVSWGVLRVERLLAAESIALAASFGPIIVNGQGVDRQWNVDDTF